MAERQAEKVILRKSKDGSLFFIEGEARGFWLGADKLARVTPDLFRAPYAGVFSYSGYARRWISMRGLVVLQGAPEEASADDPRVIDYRAKTLADAERAPVAAKQAERKRAR